MTADVTQITKVSAHVKTSGWGNKYLTVVTLFHSILESLCVKSMAKAYDRVCS